MEIDDRLRELGFEPVDIVNMNEYFDRGRQYAEGTDIPLISSNVARVRYVKSTNDLYIAFDNHREKAGERLYCYHGFAGLEDVYDNLFSSGSPGGIVWDNLRRPGVTFTRM